MESPYRLERNTRRRSTILLLTLLMVIGLAGSAVGAISINLRSRSFLKSRAATIADALPISDVKQLEGNETDLAKPAYERLKSKLIKIRGHNADLRFVYLMGQKNGEMFFYVDSEPSDSDSYSPPGEPYPEASEELKSIFIHKRTFVEGPMRDKYGAWLSGLAPVTDPQTGKVVAIAGVDMPASDFYAQTVAVTILPLALIALPGLYILHQRKLIAKEDEVIGLKHQFVSIASHELRSPLGGMLWAIQSLLKSGRFSETDKHTLTDMYQSTQSSLATVNEILDSTIFDRHKQSALRQDPVELTSVVRSVETTQRLAAKENNISLVYDHSWPDKAYSRGDVAALKRAFMNLVSNAIKYSHKNGRVTFHYERHNGHHVLSVTDTGIGIPPEDIPKILQGYYRSANATKVAVHGTGIGLHITRAIIEEQGGKLEVESTEGKGTTIHVWLPVLDHKSIQK